MTSEMLERVYRYALRRAWQYGRGTTARVIARAVGMTEEEVREARELLCASGLLGDRRLKAHGLRYVPDVIGMAWVNGEERWVTPL